MKAASFFHLSVLVILSFCQYTLKFDYSAESRFCGTKIGTCTRTRNWLTVLCDAFVLYEHVLAIQVKDTTIVNDFIILIKRNFLPWIYNNFINWWPTKKKWLSNYSHCNDLTASFYVIRFQFDIHYFYFSFPSILSLTFKGSALFVCVHKDIGYETNIRTSINFIWNYKATFYVHTLSILRKRRNGKISL